jgi:hypothetical protein
LDDRAATRLSQVNGKNYDSPAPSLIQSFIQRIALAGLEARELASHLYLSYA